MGFMTSQLDKEKGSGVGGISGEKNHKPYYVLDIDTKLNKVIVGPRDQLKKNIMSILKI